MPLRFVPFEYVSAHSCLETISLLWSPLATDICIELRCALCRPWRNNRTAGVGLNGDGSQRIHPCRGPRRLMCAYLFGRSRWRLFWHKPRAHVSLHVAAHPCLLASTPANTYPPLEVLLALASLDVATSKPVLVNISARAPCLLVSA